MTLPLLLSTLLLTGSALAADLPVATKELTQGLANPLWVGSTPDNPQRLYVCEQRSGLIRTVDAADGTLGDAPFLRVAGILSSGNEQGLLGLAFHPQYAKNGRLFVYLTAPGGGKAGRVEIREYHATPGAATADPEPVRLVLAIDQPEANHNGGWIAFGPDHLLYLGVGDGGGANDRHGKIGHGQDRSTLLAKMLRIDIDQAQPYAVPPGNPFTGPGERGEIWAFGLRNPWRCSFDRKTGDIWIGDVGQNAREEIDLIPAGQKGLNFGWRPREGTIATPSFHEEPVTPATEPVLDYTRDQGVSVTGGYVYRGTAIPELAGWYLFADFATARIWAIPTEVPPGQPREQRELTHLLNPQRGIKGLASFGEDAAGELYVCSWMDGRILKIVRR